MSSIVYLDDVSCDADYVLSLAVKRLEEGFAVTVRYKNCPEPDVCCIYADYSSAHQAKSIFEFRVKEAQTKTCNNN